MEREPLYLRPDVQVEPLVDHWYAWSHLIPPATAARNLTERHLKIMDSYIQAPEIHAAAAKNPKFLGGPFIDYDGARVDEIVALRDQTKHARAHLLELSAALEALDHCLRMGARGFSLQSLYDRIPQPLRGYVELVYDLSNQPSFRIIEPLLYRSKYYDRSAQSLMFSVTKGDERPFVLSTPRLSGDGLLHLPAAFGDSMARSIYGLLRTPQPWEVIKRMFGHFVEPDDTLLRSILTPAIPRPYVGYNGAGARWRYFGHACILVETPSSSFFFDPVISYTYDTTLPRYTYLDLPEHIDYALITHNHQDHVLFETLLQIRDRVGAIVVPRSGGGSLQDPSIKLVLQNCGFDNVVELGEFETIPTKSGSITGLPFLGEHADLDVRSKLAYLIRTRNRSMLFAADSCNIEPELYKHVYEETGTIDAVFLGMECDGAPLTWLYGPLLTQPIERGMDESRRLAGSNFEQALDIITRFRCKEAYVYAMGQEPWLNHIMSIKYSSKSRPILESDRLVSWCAEHGIYAERLFGEKELRFDC
jgi:L-ascorbate metabolism protein UlaG (beta-lactamase superfamily)